MPVTYTSGFCSSCCGTPGTISTGCCPNLIAATLHASISAGGGACACVANFTLNYVSTVSGNAIWKGNSASSCPNGSLDFTLTCNGGTGLWELTSTACGLGVPLHPTSPSCSPFSLTFTVTCAPACAGNFTLTVTS